VHEGKPGSQGSPREISRHFSSSRHSVRRLGAESMTFSCGGVLSATFSSLKKTTSAEDHLERGVILLFQAAQRSGMLYR